MSRAREVSLGRLRYVVGTSSGPIDGRGASSDSCDDSDMGAAVAEFAMIAILLVFLLFAVLQVAAYFYVRSLIRAQVDSAARAAAVSGVDPATACPRTVQLLRANVSGSVADSITCTVTVVDVGQGLSVVKVQTHGSVRTSFLPMGALLHLDVTAEALQEPSR